MFNFSQYLQDGEQILYQGKSSFNKGSVFFKIVCSIIILCAIIIFTFVTWIEIKVVDIDFFNLFVIFLVTILFLTVGISIFRFYFRRKKENVRNVFFCITNIRIMKYASRENKLYSGYLKLYDDIHCYNKKNNYGDLYFGNILNNKLSDSTVVSEKMNTNQNNVPCIILESIENPELVLNIVKKVRNDRSYYEKQN